MVSGHLVLSILRICARCAGQARILSVCLGCLLLGACASQSIVDGSVDNTALTSSDEAPINDVETLIAEGDIDRLVQLYEQRIRDAASNAERQHYQLRLIEVFLLFGRTALAESHLASLTPPLGSPSMDQRYQVAKAHLLLLGNNFDGVIELLKRDLTRWGPETRAKALQVRSRAYERLGSPVLALHDAMLLEPLLQEQDAIDSNQQRIWRLLSNLSDIQLAELVGIDQSFSSRGWIALAELMRTYKGDDLRAASSRWATQYPGHSAQARLLQKLLQFAIVAPGQSAIKVAVLLPFHGEWRQSAEAVRDGFLAAYYEHPAHLPHQVAFYDTSDPKRDFRQQYRQALADGADIVVGPLRKELLRYFFTRKKLPVPMITLNYYDGAAVSPFSNIFQFGLSPEQDAEAVADFAYARGYRHALALVPDDSWGDRMLSGFSNQFEQLGGQLIDQQIYDVGAHDFSTPIKRLLNINESQGRHRTLEVVLGQDVKFEPQIRQDADFIFLVGNDKKTRQLLPQLKYHRASDLPMLTTFNAFSGRLDQEVDRDLDGVLVYGAPWTLLHSVLKPPLYNSIAKHWPQSQSRSLIRLYALGADAYSLVVDLHRFKQDKEHVLSGYIGDWVLDEDNRFRRKGRWAKFFDGAPVLLPTSIKSSRVLFLD